MIRAWLAMVLCVFVVGTAHAHKASDAYLQLQPDGAGVVLRWDIALRDLDAALPIDADNDRRITFGEVQRAWPAIEAYALPRLRWPRGCEPQVAGHALERRSDGAYAVLVLRAACAMTRDFALGYTLFAEVDPTHRGLLRIVRDGQTRVEVLAPADTGPLSAAPTPSFVREGVHHIVTGYDHVLFLLCLLLPAVVRREHGRWIAVERWREALAPVLTVVTLFTVAHSITLALAALDLVAIPSRVIEPAIAATIIVAALDNLRPVFGRARFGLTFAFGLVHGFGFAGVLKEVNLPTAEFGWALLKFNLGLECGQLAIVAVVVPVLFALRRRHGYPRWVLAVGSSAAIVLAGIWFVERVVDVSLLPM